MRVRLLAPCAASLFEVEILSRRKSREVLPDTDRRKRDSVGDKLFTFY
jgi:hypothetical protein